MCILELKEHVRKTREVFVSRCKVSNLKEAHISTAFREKVQEKLAGRHDGNGDIDLVCGGLRNCLLDVANEVCGRTKTQQQHRLVGGMMKLQRSIRRNGDYIISTKTRRKCQINW